MSVSSIVPDVFPWLDVKRYTYSLGLQVGRRAILSGHTASRFDPEANRIVIEGGMAEQARLTYAKIEAILGAAGLGFPDVAMLVEYVPSHGMVDYAILEEVRASAFGQHRPAVSTVVVSTLFRPALIEIEVLAGVPGSPITVGSVSRPAFASARASGEVLFLSSLPSVGETGDGLGGSDLATQAQRIYEIAGRTLQDAGFGWDGIVKTVDYLTPAAIPSYPAIEQIRRRYFGSFLPAATTVVLKRLAHPGALIQVEFIASSAAREAVDHPAPPSSGPPCSPAVRAGDLLFVSGQTAVDTTSGQPLHPGDIAAQAEAAYTSLLGLLEATGIPVENLVKTVEYVSPSGVDRYRETGAVRSRLLPPPYPASTGVGSEGLIQPGLEIQVDATAFIE